MAAPLFITGIGTGIGKTLVAAIVTEALKADYWKPVQAGFSEGTDTGWVKDRITNPKTICHEEVYKLKLPASPHIAAREEGLKISVASIIRATPLTESQLVVEGAGGILVPLNDQEFVLDLAQAMNAKIILVSRNYLGSINHSLLTAAVCRMRGIPVLGWIFNDQYGAYESEIVRWTDLPALGSIPFSNNCNRSFISEQATKLAPNIIARL